MFGEHCIKTWSAIQEAFALSCAEAELCAMVEGVARAKGIVNLAGELGIHGLSNFVRLGSDRSAAKSFVCCHGFKPDEALCGGVQSEEFRMGIVVAFHFSFILPLHLPRL